jgi:hypothetical protein
LQDWFLFSGNPSGFLGKILSIRFPFPRARTAPSLWKTGKVFENHGFSRISFRPALWPAAGAGDSERRACFLKKGVDRTGITGFPGIDENERRSDKEGIGEKEVVVSFQPLKKKALGFVHDVTGKDLEFHSSFKKP